MKFNNLTFDIKEYIKSKIISGEFKPGQKLNETELASSLDISRPPLREAFRMLENERLIASIPRKGTYVADISLEDLEKTFAAREMIECYAIEIIGNKKLDDLSCVASSLESASRFYESHPDSDDKEKILEYVKAITEYHEKLIECADNYWLIHLFDSISSHLARYQYISLCMPGRGRYAMSEHQHIFRLIKQGSFDRAQEKTKNHIKKAFKNLKERIFTEKMTKET